MRAYLPILVLVAVLQAGLPGSDHHEYHDLGLLRPGERTSAEVSPPGTVLTGRNTSSTLIAWDGGPRRFVGSVRENGAGAHEGLFDGTWTREGGSGGRELTWDMKTQAKVMDIVLTSRTELSAPANPDRSRTLVGVCERVVITANIPMDAWHCTYGRLSSTGPGSSVVWSAPDYSGPARVFAFKDSYARPIAFTVVAPSGASYISKTDLNATLQRSTIGTKMNCQVQLQPTDVCFANVRWFEEGGRAADATATTGVFALAAQLGQPLNHNPNVNPLPVTESNMIVDGDDVGWSLRIAQPLLAALQASNSHTFRIPTKYVTPDNVRVDIETIVQTGTLAAAWVAGRDQRGPYTDYDFGSRVEKKEQNNTNAQQYRIRRQP